VRAKQTAPNAPNAQPLPWFYPGPMGDPVCQGSCLWWLVRDALTPPNAPNAAVTAPNAPKEPLRISFFTRVFNHSQKATKGDVPRQGQAVGPRDCS
jgi:hypothetical protein